MDWKCWNVFQKIVCSDQQISSDIGKQYILVSKRK